MKEKNIQKRTLPTLKEIKEYFQSYKKANNYPNELDAEEFLKYMKNHKTKENTEWKSLARIWIRYAKKQH